MYRYSRPKGKHLITIVAIHVNDKHIPHRRSSSISKFNVYLLELSSVCWDTLPHIYNPVISCVITIVKDRKWEPFNWTYRYWTIANYQWADNIIQTNEWKTKRWSYVRWLMHVVKNNLILLASRPSLYTCTRLFHTYLHVHCLPKYYSILNILKLFKSIDTYLRKLTRPSPVQIMTCRIFGAKPVAAYSSLLLIRPIETNFNGLLIENQTFPL